MSTALSVAIVALILDSILVMYAVFMQKWRLLLIGVIIGALIDLYIFNQGA